MNDSASPFAWPGLRLSRLAVRAALILFAASGWAQGAATGSPGAASAPEVVPRLRPVPSLTNSSDAQRSMDLNNEQAGGKVMPQLRIPLGKKGGPPVFERRRGANPAASASAGSIDDSAARCESQADQRARADCRSQAARP